MIHREVVGLDPSVTSFGVGRVSAAGEVVFSRAIRPAKSLSAVERLEFLRDQVLSEVVGVYDWDEALPMVVLEGYAFSRVNLTHLAEVVGVVKVALHEAKVPVRILTPSGLKKFVTGRGNAKKDEMRLEIYKRFEFEDPSVDALEAVALAYAGWHWLRLGEDGEGERSKVPVRHLEGLSKMEEYC